MLTRASQTFTISPPLFFSGTLFVYAELAIDILQSRNFESFGPLIARFFVPVVDFLLKLP